MRLRGRTVLDVGAYDGFYSFEAERRGAKRVVAADHWVWNWPGSDARGNVELARSVLDSSVEMAEVSVEDMSPQSLGSTFDVVLFLGVLYHAASMNGDASNNFGPNRLAVEAMLLDGGFSRVVAFDPSTASEDWGIRTRRALSLTGRLTQRLRRPRSGRMVFHAYV